MKNYGVPYKGSKSRIADKMAKEAIPYGVENFYDLFAGGCAMTHRMIEGGKFTRYHANDLNGQGLKLFIDAIDGKYKDEKRWISREDFAALKGVNPYVSICWSFGNNQDNYLYSKEIEPWKRALHYARVLGDKSLLKEFDIDSDGSRMDIMAHMDEYKRKYIRWWLSKQPYSQEELESLQRLQSLEPTFLDYRDVMVEKNSIVYCDPPYKGTDGYEHGEGSLKFDHEEFYDWCESQSELVLVSEYSMPEDRFDEVWSINSRSTLGSTSNKAVTERLFVPKKQKDRYDYLMSHSIRRCVQLSLF